MERKEVDTQQFIDHTLLATELMHNNFMMDYIDHTGVFPKTEAPTNLSTTGSTPNVSDVGYVSEKQDALTPPELNFHNTIFQFVNKHVVDEPSATRPSDVPTSPKRSRNTYAKESVEEFLTLNSSFLNDAAAAAAAAAAASTSDTNGVVPQPGSQTDFPALSIEPTVPIDVAQVLEDDDLLYAHSASTTNARKVLPHKKRISRKLKGTLAYTETDMELEQHGKHGHSHVQVPVVATYSCELCAYAVHTQIEFYAHLKEHYDPSSLEQRLDAPQQQQQQQQQQKEPLDMCGLSAEDKLQQEQAKLDQVFHDVQLNFENFHNINHVDDDVVDDVGVNMVIHADSISLHKTDDKMTPVGTTNGPNASHDVPVVDDVEFSDTEDMLEGIRNVVDKVSIEDTCDELVELELTTSGMRAPWFNTNFSDIAFSGLLLPGEPPPLKQTPIEAEQMTLNFLNTDNNNKREEEEAQAQQPQQSKLELQCKKDYIEASATPTVGAPEESSESNEQTLLVSPPSRTPSSTPTPSAGSAIEQLQRSPLILNDTFKLEDVDAAASATPAESITSASSPAADMTDDNGDIYIIDSEDKPSNDDSYSKRKFHCEKCARDFNSYNALKYHQHTHTKERAYQCKSCDRSFYTQSALKAHERTHSGVKPYKCEHCEYRFRTWGDLKYHCTSRHSDVKAHMCEYCGKSFSRKYSLVVHRRIHTSERNYACQYCEKTFRASSYLLAHIKVHTGERPYGCSICGKKFRVSGDLKRHLRIHERPRSGLDSTPDNGGGAKLKQIEDEDEDATLNQKSDALCSETEQEILGL